LTVVMDVIVMVWLSLCML